MFAAFIAVLGIFPGLYLGGSGVPIVIQNAGPVLAGAILGARRGTASVVLLLALVAMGLPLLSGGRGGLAPFIGPSGGFIFGWILAALVAGLIVQRAERPGLPVLALATTAGFLTQYLIGIPFLGAYTGDLGAAAVQSLVFLPGDAAKMAAVATIAAVVHRALPGTLTRPAVRGE
ncbi:biotin transporter BioY [Prauserella sp. ASG 168]|uniref:Biotin transporter n=1 Tax=Prauserella cavernicola TaxID=2800127 RepID=A0A934V240_9PSEU|nr:biotin transporter BioY [Prauserella cavernicola]